MKKAACIITALIALSCSLREVPESFVDRGSYFRNEAQLQSAVNSVYAQLRTLYSYRFFTLTEATTDIMYVRATTVVESRMELSPAQPGYSATIWQKCYQMVMYSNYVIEGARKSALDYEKKAPYIAEAVIMRAFYYYLLTSFFGDVPYYTEDVSDAETMNAVAALPRMSAFETRKALIGQIREYLSYDENGNRRTLADLDYLHTSNPDAELDFAINADSVLDAWQRLSGNMDNDLAYLFLS